jgi:hypothetical protein
MKGGAREQLLDIAKKYAQPLSVYLAIALVLGITYVGRIPDHYTYQANTMIGRFFLFAITIFVADTYSWIYALLMALFTVLVIAVAPRTLREGFQANGGAAGTDMETKLVSQKKRWWSEEILQENPIGIEEEKVRTSAIQDAGSSSSNSTTSSR